MPSGPQAHLCWAHGGGVSRHLGCLHGPEAAVKEPWRFALQHLGTVRENGPSPVGPRGKKSSSSTSCLSSSCCARLGLRMQGIAKPGGTAVGGNSKREGDAQIHSVGSRSDSFANCLRCAKRIGQALVGTTAWAASSQSDIQLAAREAQTFISLVAGLFVAHGPFWVVFWVAA